MMVMIMIMTGDTTKDNYGGLDCFPGSHVILRHKPPMPSSPLIIFCLPVTLALLFLLLPAACVDPAANCHQGDQASLLSFSSNLSVSGPALNWSAAGDCCNWEGVACDANDGRVIRLRLPSRGLNGYFSPSLANLTGLSYLILSSNRLFGPIPETFFSSLSSLQVLDLSYNSLSGELPSYPVDGSSRIALQVANLSSNHFRGVVVPQSLFLRAAWNLSAFNISNNSFVGLIPSDICQLSSPLIRLLDFSHNRFNGTIPSGLGGCSNLESLSAGFNDLTGPIPDDIYSIVSLVELSLPINQLVGTIRDAITNLSNLRILELYSNNLTGPIPRDIGKLYNLEYLLLHINTLNGSLPQSLSNCTKLIVLNLRVNSLAGKLWDFDFSPFSQLTTIDLGNNNFTGNLPSSLYSCTSLTAVRLANNQLEGQILAGIRSLKSLSFLSLSNNNLSNVTGAIQILMGCKNLTTLILSTNFKYEKIPVEKNKVDPNGFESVQIFALGGSFLYGQVPEWIVYLQNVRALDLSVNQLRGPVLSWLGNLSKLFYLDLSNNQLSGEFPVQLTQIRALTAKGAIDNVNGSYLQLPVFAAQINATNQLHNRLANMPRALYFANNSLDGSIPPEIGRLKYLHLLDLSHNNFSGVIPDELSELTNLEKLDLSYNDLSGEIPQSLKSLHFLSSFSVEDNNLRGPLLSGGQFDTFEASGFEGNPELCGTILQRSCSNPTSPAHSVTLVASRGGSNLPIEWEAALIAYGGGLVVGLAIGFRFLRTSWFVKIIETRKKKPRKRRVRRRR